MSLHSPFLQSLLEAHRRRPRIYILPTAYGALFGLLLLAMLAASINYDLSLGYVAVFLLGGVLWVGMVHTHRNIARVKFLGAKADPVFAQDPAQFLVSLDNRGESPCFAIEIRFLDRNRGPSTVFDPPGDALASACLAVPTSRRGWLRMDRIRLSTRFPLGLFYAWTSRDASGAKCLVYPRPQGGRRLPQKEGESSHGFSGKRDGVDDFLGFRPYHPGDPPRSIAWKALAREHGVLVKRFVGNEATGVWLSWNAVRALRDDEARLSQLCLWVLEADASNVSYGLRLPGKTIKLGLGPTQRQLCLEALACYGAP